MEDMYLDYRLHVSRTLVFILHMLEPYPGIRFDEELIL